MVQMSKMISDNVYMFSFYFKQLYYITHWHIFMNSFIEPKSFEVKAAMSCLVECSAASVPTGKCTILYSLNY